MKTKDSEPELLVTVTLIVADIARSVAFYRDVLGATVLREGEPTFLKLANIWIASTEVAVQRTTSRRSLPLHPKMPTH